ncbi:MAG: class I SAM-dependent methyltransferase [Candidatus Hodarchaeota archaeon]
MNNKKFAIDPKVRFSSRVDNYIKYRPKYPQEIIKFLTEKRILTKESKIADIGSGTGILSELFLKNGNPVYGVEPNIDMRKAGEILLEKYANFFSVDGSAESTGIEKMSIDLITAGQAFHWFNIEKAKLEFKRILKPNGYVVLIWNNRKKEGNNFSHEYENLVSKYGIDYKEVRKQEGAVGKFFNYERKIFYNYQETDYEGFKGRFLSASYIPLEDDPIFPEMISKLKEIFFKFEKNGIIKLEYDTEVYYGQL